MKRRALVSMHEQGAQPLGPVALDPFAQPVNAGNVVLKYRPRRMKVRGTAPLISRPTDAARRWHHASVKAH